MNLSAPGLITAYLLACLAGTAPLLLIIGAIACPLVWSRNPERRARARDTLHLLAPVLAGRRTR